MLDAASSWGGEGGEGARLNSVAGRRGHDTGDFNSPALQNAHHFRRPAIAILREMLTFPLVARF
jgi:hypothetical protein